MFGTALRQSKVDDGEEAVMGLENAMHACAA
jgi:hypothetical protein